MGRVPLTTVHVFDSGQDFGITDGGAWDDGSSLDMGSSDWDT